MDTSEAVDHVIAAALWSASPDVVDVDPHLLSVLLSPWARVFAFVFGAMWGSFANVVIHRVPQGLSVWRPRSRCPSCETPVAAYDNIPILSYLILRGRCRHCGEPFSARYMVVEALAGILCFALYIQQVHVPLVEGGAPQLAAWALWFLFGLALLVIIYIDLDWWIIPNAIVFPVAAVGALAAGLAPELLGIPLVEALATAAVAYAFFAGMRWLYLKLRSIEALGLGDAKLLVMVAVFTGWKGTFWTVSAGAVQGLLVAVPMLLVGRNVANRELTDVHGDDPELGEEDPDRGVMGRRVPFGPFLALAALELVLLRSQIDALLRVAFGGL